VRGHQVTEPDVATRLGIVGVGELEERAYRHLIEAGEGRSAGQVAQVLRISPRSGRELLNSLESQGLVTRTGSHPVSYLASAPEVALAPLLSRSSAELDRVRTLAAELQGQYRQATLRGPGFIEVIRGRDQVLQYYLHLVRSARTGLDILTKPPYVAGDDVSRTLHAENAGIRRGVRSRSVYDGDALHQQATLSIAQQSIDFGEEARAIVGLPTKLVIVDGGTAFMPLDVRSPTMGALLVHASPLLEALIALFEGIWSRAAPMKAPGPGPDQPDERSLQVLRLMAAGLKDESIARALNMSRRTVQKHVSAMMAALGARTRFQAAVLAGQRGWVGPETQP
jgi:DNA-binding CsgD family transcriptional regulator/sugar-specific transcriptional regulator TrmB